MRRTPTIFLRGVLSLAGIVILALCVFVLPAGISSDNTGYYRPILLGMYATAAPFFTALYQAMKLLGYIDKDKAFSDLSVKALRIIKYCAAAIGAMYTAGMPYIYYAADKDDAPGVVALGLVITFASVTVAAFASVLQKLLQTPPRH